MILLVNPSDSEKHRRETTERDVLPPLRNGCQNVGHPLNCDREEAMSPIERVGAHPANIEALIELEDPAVVGNINRRNKLVLNLAPQIVAEQMLLSLFEKLPFSVGLHCELFLCVCALIHY